MYRLAPLRASLNSPGSRLAAAVTLIALALLVSACGPSDDSSNGGEQGQDSGSGGGAEQSTSPETTGMEGTSMEGTSMGATSMEGTGMEDTSSMGTTGMEGTSMGETTGGATLAGGPQDEIRDGTWRVDGAGTVRFSFTDGGVELGEVSPNSGWDQRVAEESDDGLEVRFTREDTDWKFQAGVDGGQAEISTGRDIQPAEAGSYMVGDAAEVGFSSEGGTLTLDNVDARDGWRVTEQDESSDEIELEFARGNLTAEFEAELSDGQINLETSRKVSGPVPN